MRLSDRDVYDLINKCSDISRRIRSALVAEFGPQISPFIQREIYPLAALLSLIGIGAPEENENHKV